MRSVMNKIAVFGIFQILFYTFFVLPTIVQAQDSAVLETPSPTAVQETIVPSQTITETPSPAPETSPSASPTPDAESELSPTTEVTPSATPEISLTEAPTETPSPAPTETIPVEVCTEETLFVSEVVSNQQGMQANNLSVQFGRSILANAMGPLDTKFYSTGLNGIMTLGLKKPLRVTDTAVLRVYEVTNGRSLYYEEKGLVSVSPDNVVWHTFPTSITSKATDGINTYFLNTTGFETVRYVRIQDQTVPPAWDAVADGLEIDTIDIQGNSCASDDPVITPSPTLVPPTVTPTATSTPTPTATMTPSPSPTNTSTPTIVNMPPVANAGVDASIVLPETYQLRGSYSDDGLPNGSINTNWRMISGPGFIRFVTLDPLQPVIQFDTPGEYVFQFTVSDAEYSTSDTVKLIVLPAEDPDAQEIPQIASVSRTYMLCYSLPILGRRCNLDLSVSGLHFKEYSTVEYRENGSSNWIPLSSNGYVSGIQLKPSFVYIKGDRAYDLRITNTADAFVIIPNAFTTTE